MTDTRTRIFTITIFHSVMKPNDTLERLKELERKSQIVGAVLGATENTKQEKKHNHLLIKYVNKKTLEQVSNDFPKCHIEQVRGTLEQAYSYTTKETTQETPNIYDTLQDIMNRQKQASTNDILQIIATELLNGTDLKELLKVPLYQPIIIKYYNQLKHIIDDLTYGRMYR